MTVTSTKSLVGLAFTLVTLSLVHAQEPILNPTNPCAPFRVGDRVSFKNKDRRPACAILQDSRPFSNVPPMYFPLLPRVDQFSMLTLNGSDTFVSQVIASGGSPADVQVTFEIGGISSIPKTWGNDVARVAFWTMMIGLNEGKFFSLVWDDSRGCKDCGGVDGSSCISQTGNFTDSMECGVEEEFVTRAAGGRTASFLNCDDLPCPMKVYIVWIGTDGDKRPLESAGLRFSEMKKYSITSAIKAGRASTFGAASTVSMSQWGVALLTVLAVIVSWL